MYKAILISATTLIPEVIDIDFELKGEWLYVIRGGVTGFESANVKSLVEKYPKRGVFSQWVACAGTLNLYHRLEIPMSEVIKFLEKKKTIEVKRSYGYPKEIIFLQDLGDS